MRGKRQLQNTVGSRTKNANALGRLFQINSLWLRLPESNTDSQNHAPGCLWQRRPWLCTAPDGCLQLALSTTDFPRYGLPS